MHQQLRAGREWLTIAATAFMATNLIHTADHARQGISGVRTAVLVAGGGLTVAAVTGLWLAIAGHRHAALFATIVGFDAFFGIAASHLAPDWGALSDSYPKIHADALSWAFSVSSGYRLCARKGVCEPTRL